MWSRGLKPFLGERVSSLREAHGTIWDQIFFGDASKRISREDALADSVKKSALRKLHNRLYMYGLL